ncbi:mucin-22-like [Tribolium castaneum]|uniref:mucin-22-like n=1 Tax=Tribolium castaneum TaxID=7070 RepID=UPI00046BFCED|nr:PREDICTED: mucin-22-like [Tribolium castaneum]|eukprot:XP_008194596.1 PREDICTED: mucin-22-like [Tribolium castaneum]
MLKFLLITCLIIIEYETRNIYISGGFHYKGKGNSKIYVVKSEPPSQFNPIISECNRKKCVSDEVCYYNKCCYESLCGHNICKRTCDETQDIAIKETTTFAATEDTHSTSITELEDSSTTTETTLFPTTTTTLSTISSTYNEPEETTFSTSDITETTSVITTTITDSSTSEGTSTVTTISPATTTVVSSTITENHTSGTSEDTSTISTTDSTTYVTETTTNSTIIPTFASSTETDRSGTSDDLKDHTFTSSTIVTSTLTTTQSTQTNEDVSTTTVEIKTTSKYDDTSEVEGSGAISTSSPNVNKDDNITFVDEDENGSGSGDGIAIRHENKNQKIVKKEVESGDFIFIDSTSKPKEDKYFSIDAISQIGVTTIPTYSTKSVTLQKNNVKNILEKEFFFDDSEDGTDDKYSGSGGSQDHYDGDNYSGSGDDEDVVSDKHPGNEVDKILINEELDKNSTVKETDKDFEDYLDVISSDLLAMNLTSISDDYFIIVDGYDYSFGGQEKEIEDNIV